MRNIQTVSTNAATAINNLFCSIEPECQAEIEDSLGRPVSELVVELNALEQLQSSEVLVGDARAAFDMLLEGADTENVFKWEMAIYEELISVTSQ